MYTRFQLTLTAPNLFWEAYESVPISGKHGGISSGVIVKPRVEDNEGKNVQTNVHVGNPFILRGNS